MENIQKSWVFLDTSKRRKEVFLTLKNKPLGVLDIAKITNLKHSNVSVLLNQLVKENLVVCLTPEKRTWRRFDLTEFGREVLNKFYKK